MGVEILVGTRSWQGAEVSLIGWQVGLCGTRRDLTLQNRICWVQGDPVLPGPVQ